jgi:hypothetical protein
VAPRPYLIVRRSRQGWTVRPDIFRFTERSEYAAAQDERLPSTEPRYDLLQCNAIVVPSLTRALFDSPSPSIGYMVKASVSTREDLAMLLKLGEQIRQAYERAEGCARREDCCRLSRGMRLGSMSNTQPGICEAT